MQKLYKINIEGEEYTVGYPASVLVGQLEEELETLRASNTIKQANIELLEAENAKLIAERDRLQTRFDLLVKDTEKLQESYNQLRVDRFKIFHEDECWIYDENEDNNLHSLVCPVVIKASVLQSVLEENKRLHAEREAMMKQTHKRADELLVGDHIKKYGEAIKIFQITNNGGYIRINFDETYLPPEAIIEMAYVPLPAQQIPEGYALVPIEPTEEMRDAANRVDELLEADNAKLIAERDKWMQYSAAVNKVSAFKSNDLNNLKGYIYELTSERDALLAEREAMMKQEPASDAERLIARNKRIEWCKGLSVSAANSLINAGIDSRAKLNEFIQSGADIKNLAGVGEKIKKEILYWVTYQTPAQQIPEGYEKLLEYWHASRNMYYIGDVSAEKEREYEDRYEKATSAVYAMLSASQPKGDV